MTIPRRYLLDTHAILWLAFDDSRLSKLARTAINQGSNTFVVSVASPWEIAVKVAVGKVSFGLSVSELFRAHVLKSNVSMLDISLEHADLAAKLPLHHRDPFDRLLIAQGISEGLPILSADQRSDSYGIERVW